MSVLSTRNVGAGERIGLLAGAGRFPVAFAEAGLQGISVFGVGVRGMASDQLHSICDYYTTAALTRFGRALRLFKAARVDRVVMAGKVEKAFLFHRFRWIRNFPDSAHYSHDPALRRENRKDDTLMLALHPRVRAGQHHV